MNIRSSLDNSSMTLTPLIMTGHPVLNILPMVHALLYTIWLSQVVTSRHYSGLGKKWYVHSNEKIKNNKKEPTKFY